MPSGVSFERSVVLWFLTGYGLFQQQCGTIPAHGCVVLQKDSLVNGRYMNSNANGSKGNNTGDSDNSNYNHGDNGDNSSNGDNSNTMNHSNTSYTRYTNYASYSGYTITVHRSYTGVVVCTDL